MVEYVNTMEVLLISPQDPKVPSNLKFLMGGENTYTQSLLSHPPKGVIYTHHTQALQNGDIEYVPLQDLLSGFMKFRIFPLDSGSHCIRLIKHFDLIHCHSYNLKIVGDIHPPVILGDSSSNYLFLKDYLGWSERRIRLQYLLRKKVHSLFGVYDRDLNLQNCQKLIVFSEFAKKIHVSLGADPKKVAVIYPGIYKRKIIPKKQNKIVNILFAGVWFERKGGLILLKAYELLKKKYSNIHLTLLGPLPKNISIDRKVITQIDFVSYERLLTEFYPNTDIFVLVPPKADGFGLVSVEALSFGIPVIVSNVSALPEIIEDGESGFIVQPGNVNDLMKSLERLINSKKLREHMSQAARENFLLRFTSEIMNEQLLKLYKNAIKHKQ